MVEVIEALDRFVVQCDKDSTKQKFDRSNLSPFGVAQCDWFAGETIKTCICREHIKLGFMFSGAENRVKELKRGTW